MNLSQWVCWTKSFNTAADHFKDEAWSDLVHGVQCMDISPITFSTSHGPQVWSTCARVEREWDKICESLRHSLMFWVSYGRSICNLPEILFQHELEQWMKRNLQDLILQYFDRGSYDKTRPTNTPIDNKRCTNNLPLCQLRDKTSNLDKSWLLIMIDP